MSEFRKVIQEAADFVSNRSGQVLEMSPRNGDLRDRGTALEFREDAAPPRDAFDQLCEDREFKRTWDHKRKDLTDQSTDSYDLALARIAVNAGWPDQQVVDLIICHRGRQIELLRLGEPYYANLLAKAKVGVPKENGGDSGDRERVPQLLGVLSRALGIKIIAVTKYGANGGTYELTLEDGRKADLGPAVNVLSHRLAKAAIADATGGEVIRPFKQAEWDKVVSAILKCAGPAPVEQASDQQEMSWWLQSCLRESVILEIDERDKTGLTKIIRERKSEWAFRNERGHVLISLGGFLRSVQINCGARPTWKDACLRLRKLGFRPRDLDGRPDGEGKARLNVWWSEDWRPDA